MDFLYYDIRVAALIAVFYMFYRLLLSRDSLHQLNRAVLLGTAVASFVLPLCVITIHHTEVLSTAPANTSVAIDGSAAVFSATPWWHTALVAAYWAGVMITIFHIIFSISKVCILISRCEKHRQADGTVIAVADGEVSPFSWMHYIVVPRSDYAHPVSAILTHEREHIRRHHSWDVLLVDILTSFQWFNPAMWMLRADLRAIHEYEADSAVLSSGVDARQYQYLLVRKAIAAAGYSVVNGINHSTLKQRITMMNIHKQNRYSWLKALYVLPVVAVSLAMSARTVTDYKVAGAAAPVSSQPSATAGLPAAGNASATGEGKIEQKQKGKTAKTVKKVAAAANDATTKQAGQEKNGTTKCWDSPEEMPQFKGGTAAMTQYISQNIKYPAIAKDCAVQGRVVVSFIVKADGSIGDARVVYNGTKHTPVTKPAGEQKETAATAAAPDEAKIGEAREALANEALRVVNSMPAWEPGKNDGKPVNVKYHIPLSFRMK